MLNFSKLRITHKGMIIVAIPLCFELFFLGLLWHLLEESEAETQRTQHSKEIIAGSDGLIKMYYDAGTTLVDYGFHQRDTSAMLYEELLKQIPKTFKELHELVGDQPEQQATLGRIEKVGDEGMFLMNDVYAKLKDGERSPLKFLALQSHRKKLEGIMTELSAELKTFIEPEIEREKNSELKARIKRGEIKALMIAGVTCSILLALMVAISLTRNIVFRIARVSDNTARLAEGKELGEPLAGTDEIAYLDSVFRSYVAKKQEVEQLKQDFLNMVSHDLRTPLCSVGSLLELFSADVYGPISDVGQERLAMAQGEVDRLLQLINALLDIEKMEAGKMILDKEERKFSALADQAAESVSAFAQKQKILIAREDSDRLVNVDGDRIVQVLVNLLANAIKFSPAESRITLRCLEDGQFVRIEVADQGRGIPEELQGRIFERYEQVKASDGKPKRGTGLGLAICKAIVECHGGTIGVSSRQGEGSTFWFTLPVQVATAEVSV